MDANRAEAKVSQQIAAIPLIFASAVTRAVRTANRQIRACSASAGLVLPVYTSVAVDNGHVLHLLRLKGMLELRNEMVEKPLAEVSLLASGPAELERAVRSTVATIHPVPVSPGLSRHRPLDITSITKCSYIVSNIYIFYELHSDNG